MAEVAAVDLRRVDDNESESANGRPRHSALLTAVVLSALVLIACSETHHTVGVFDEAQTGGMSGTSGTRAPNPQGGGGAAPIDDGSIGMLDAAVAIPDAAPQCTEVLATLRKPLNLYLMIDTNFLVADGGQWSKVQQGILAYSRNEAAAGTGLGLRLIDPPPSIPLLPLDSLACQPGTYSRENDMIDTSVVTQPLPTNVDEISDVLNVVTGSLTTPLDPALQGAIDLAFSLKNRRPDEEQAVVLMSDAFLDFSCATTTEQLIQSAALGRNEYGIRSYMLELLDPTIFLLPDLAQFAGTFIPLDPVAAAGGTDRARSFNLSEDDPAVLAERLLEIQRDAEPCEYALPSGMDWSELLLAVDTGVGPGPLPRLNDEVECGVGGGAFISYVDPIAGTVWAKACATSCQAIKSLRRDPLWIIGCDL
jgi:hypothetical protein